LPQTTCGARQSRHPPLVHVALAGHGLPQPPQWSLSLAVLTQTPPQRSSGRRHGSVKPPSVADPSRGAPVSMAPLSMTLLSRTPLSMGAATSGRVPLSGGATSETIGALSSGDEALSSATLASSVRAASIAPTPASIVTSAAASRSRIGTLVHASALTATENAIKRRRYED
jgi:hypothetical protein